jgi:hypothetical protein
MTFSDGKIEATIDGEIEKKDKKVNHQKIIKEFPTA